MWMCGSTHFQQGGLSVNRVRIVIMAGMMLVLSLGLGFSGGTVSHAQSANGSGIYQSSTPTPSLGSGGDKDPGTCLPGNPDC